MVSYVALENRGPLFRNLQTLLQDLLPANLSYFQTVRDMQENQSSQFSYVSTILLVTFIHKFIYIPCHDIQD